MWAASGQGRVRGDREQFKGRGLLSINDADSVFRFKFKEIDQIFRDVNDDPFGVVFSGQAQVTDSEGTEKFGFTAAEIMPATEAPERLIWDIRGSNNLSLQFVTLSVKFR